jgi:hypothetical protein
MRSAALAGTTAYLLVRAFVCLLGLAAIAWGGFLLPLFWRDAPLNRIESELLQGHAFKMQVLLENAQQAIPQQSLFCDPIALHDAVILRLNILDNALAVRNQTLVDSGSNRLHAATQRALTCAPADSFAWLTLFWLSARKHGFEQDDAVYLRLSYALGPNEGWIALPRSRLAIAMFTQLPPDLANDAINDFVKLVDTGTLYPEAVAIFAGAAPGVRSLLVERLKSSKPIPREIFARALYDKGFNIDVPGADRPVRPWQ